MEVNRLESIEEYLLIAKDKKGAVVSKFNVPADRRLRFRRIYLEEGFTVELTPVSKPIESKDA
jgi:hypothetical protein